MPQEVHRSYTRYIPMHDFGVTFVPDLLYTPFMVAAANSSGELMNAIIAKEKSAVRHSASSLQYL